MCRITSVPLFQYNPIFPTFSVFRSRSAQIPVLPAAVEDIYHPIFVSNSSHAFPYGTCTNTYNPSCFTFEGPTFTKYEGYQTISFVLTTNCTAPLPGGCTEDLAKIEINTSEFTGPSHHSSLPIPEG